MSVKDRIFLCPRFSKSLRQIVCLCQLILSIAFLGFRKVYISFDYFQEFMAYQNKLWNNYKSDGEKRIGDYLQKRKINFSYERPVAVLVNGKVKLWHPDFFLDDYHVLIEYLGMNGNQQSAKINDYKRGVYHANRFDVIEIYPSDFRDDWQPKIDCRIRNTLGRRVRDYASKPGYECDSQSTPRTYRETKPYRQTSFEF